MPSIITLTTDFGLDDLYVASVKGAILSINPQAVLIDICHTIEPQNIVQAAFIINIAYCHFPVDAIHVVVVDPGVGGRRHYLNLRAFRFKAESLRSIFHDKTQRENFSPQSVCFCKFLLLT